LKSIEEEFIYPPLIGLQNVGATCYMNATLQCFCQIKKLVNFFKYHHSINDIIKKIYNRDESLTYSFKYLVENLWPSENNKYIISHYNSQNSNNKYFAPYKFKEKISNMNPLFSGVAANDSKDLVNFIIMTLHDELNKAPKKSLSDINRFEVNQTNQLEILQNFIKCFANENQSIISDIFYGVNNTGTQCSGCNITKYNFQTYFFLIFPLEEVRKNKIMQCQNQLMLMNQNMMNMNMNPFLYQNFLNMQNSNVVNIFDCFDYIKNLKYL
jgi:ubiquitin C-terminal hydrolase